MKKISIEISEEKAEQTNLLAGFEGDEIILSVSSRHEINGRVKSAAEGVPQGQRISFKTTKELLNFVKTLLENTESTVEKYRNGIKKIL